MNKKEIADSIFKKLPTIKRFEAYAFVDLLIEVVSEALKEGDKVVVSRFGTFKVIQRQEKRVINPNDQSAMVIPSRRIVKFFPSKTLKESIRN